MFYIDHPGLDSWGRLTHAQTCRKVREESFTQGRLLMQRNNFSGPARTMYYIISQEIGHLAKRHQALIRRSKITCQKTRRRADTYVSLIDALTIFRRGVVVDLIANKSDTISARWVDEFFHATACKSERLMKSPDLRLIVSGLHDAVESYDHRPIPIRVIAP